MGRAQGIDAISHVAVHTARLEEAERHYAELFGAVIVFRTALHQGERVALDPAHGWDEIRAARLNVDSSLVRSGALTIALVVEPAGRDGPLGHVCLSVSDAEHRRLRERVRALGLRVLRDDPGSLRFRDGLGVTWEAVRPGRVAPRPARRLDLGTGRVG